MQKKIIFTLFALLAITQVRSLSLTVTCGVCDVNVCASKYCYYLVASDGYKQTVCQAQGAVCNTALNTTVELKNCTLDYRSDTCQTGVCYAIADKQVARFINQDCTSTFFQNFTCGTCSGGVSCPLSTPSCQSINTGSQACVKGCSMATLNTRVQPCTNGRDSLGTAKTCCMTHLGTAGPVCSSQATILASAKFVAWSTGKFENFLTIFISVILLSFSVLIL